MRARQLLLTTSSVSLLFATACTCGSGPYKGDYYDGDRPGEIAKVQFVESEKGEPKLVGCADGQREGFASLKDFPRIAGCIGDWDGSKSLRDKPTGKACGDDGEKCAVPADVCAEGWHVCGVDGQAKDLRDRVDAGQCNSAAGPGRFNAAMSHSTNDEIEPCPTIRPNTVMPCMQAGLGAEPVCCGTGCSDGHKCKDGVWPNQTNISIGTSEGCGNVTGKHNGGVLCCYDGTGNPADELKLVPAAGAADAGATPPEGEAAGEKPAAEAPGDAAKQAGVKPTPSSKPNGKSK